MGQIRIADLSVEVRLGALPEEQISPQTVQLDLNITTDVRASAGGDRLEDAVNYIEVAEVARREASRDCHLLETLVARVCDAVKVLPGVDAVEVRARKRYLPRMGPVGHVEVVMESS